LKEKCFEKKKNLIFSIFFDLFFGAPSCRLYSPLQVGLNIFGFSDLPRFCDKVFKCLKKQFQFLPMQTRPLSRHWPRVPLVTKFPVLAYSAFYRAGLGGEGERVGKVWKIKMQ
jgi:hypothetical protein